MISFLAKYRLSQRGLTQAQKYRNLLKVTNPLALTGSKHGMKSYNKGAKLLETILTNRQLGMEVKIIPRE